MRKLFYLIFALCFTVSARMSDSSAIAPTTSIEEKKVDTIAPAQAYDTSVAAVIDSTPRCTLEIATEPAGALVSLNGTSYGISPVSITDIDTGKHTLIIQKKGYFQKKAAITLTEQVKTPLVFQLSAPGRLVVVSIPDTAQITINGIGKGTTPYTDSLVKPGKYLIRISKTPFIPVEDSVVVAGGDTVTIIDTLVVSDAYRDSVATFERTAKVKARRFSIGMVAGVFGLFLLVIMIVEGQER